MKGQRFGTDTHKFMHTVHFKRLPTKERVRTVKTYDAKSLDFRPESTKACAAYMSDASIVYQDHLVDYITPDPITYPLLE